MNIPLEHLNVLLEQADIPADDFMARTTNQQGLNKFGNTTRFCWGIMNETNVTIIKGK
jgi:hypothetical protein